MKPGLLIIAFLFQIAANGQSPHLSFILKMDFLKSLAVRYKIEMKICEPKKKTNIGNWGRHQVSKIKFDSLKASDIECEEGHPTFISFYSYPDTYCPKLNV